MKLDRLNSIAFTRAYTSAEKKAWNELKNSGEIERALGNGGNETIVIIPSFSMMSSKINTGIGTLYSQDAQQVAQILHDVANVSAIQELPPGEISSFNVSPYDSTNFSLGAQNIDLSKLTTERYDFILSEEELVNSPLVVNARHKNPQVVQYQDILANNGGQTKLLKKAFDSFRELPETSILKKEFSGFKQENNYWLEKDSLFEAEVAKNNGQRDFTKWSWEDQNVFASEGGNKSIIKELKENYADEIEYAEFIQFIADKQRQEAKADFNFKGIKVYGDIPIGFSQKDIWTHKNAFYLDFKNYKFGVADDSQKDMYHCWSPAIDFNKLYNEDGSEGPAGKLLRDKFKLAFSRYDGVRVDAAWQLMNPVVVKPYTTTSNTGSLEYSEYIGDTVLTNFILNEANKAHVAHDKVFLELLGGKSYDCLDDAKKTGANLIHITRYANDGWGRVKYYETSKPGERYQNMKPGQYMIGVGTHDDISAIEQAKQGRDRATFFAKDMHMDENELRQSPRNILSAMFAELFTTKKQFATLPDMIGSERRINTPNTVGNHNWTYRLPSNFEEEYHRNLSKGMGLNVPDALAKAIKAKNGGRSTQLTNKLEQFARILSKYDDCSNTELESNVKYGANYSEIG